MADLAKIFWSGRSQAVRLPKDYRFDASEVRISREGGRVILEPIRAEPVGEATNGSMSEAAADTIDRLRAAIAEGLESGPPAPWDTSEVKRLARGN